MTAIIACQLKHFQDQCVFMIQEIAADSRLFLMCTSKPILPECHMYTSDTSRKEGVDWLGGWVEGVVSRTLGNRTGHH